MKFYPCIHNPTTYRIDIKVGPLMTQEEAEDFLKARYPDYWHKCKAIPQPESHYYFKEKDLSI